VFRKLLLLARLGLQGQKRLEGQQEVLSGPKSVWQLYLSNGVGRVGSPDMSTWPRLELPLPILRSR
jgi:hypothetical protein